MPHSHILEVDGLHTWSRGMKPQLHLISSHRYTVQTSARPVTTGDNSTFVSVGFYIIYSPAVYAAADGAQASTVPLCVSSILAVCNRNTVTTSGQ